MSEKIDLDYWEAAKGKVKLADQSITYLQNILEYINKSDNRKEYMQPIIEIINFKKYGY